MMMTMGEMMMMMIITMMVMGAQVSRVKMFLMKGSLSPCLITMLAI